MQVKLGDTTIGDGCAVYAIAEIGINHNGSFPLAVQLIQIAARAGCSAVKFQKRTVDVVYSAEELERPRESPFGSTNGDLKRGLEFDRDHYQRLKVIADEYGVALVASCWDEQALQDIEVVDPPFHKIASACLTDADLLRATCETGKPILLSTGMSTVAEIDAAVDLIQAYGNPLVLMHCTSEYPCPTERLNLRCIPWLRERYGCLVGYSGHELGLSTTVAAAVLGACVVERHITIDRSMFGSDQSASLEPQGLVRMLRDIWKVQVALGDGVKVIYDQELPTRDKLRRVVTL